MAAPTLLKLLEVDPIPYVRVNSVDKPPSWLDRDRFRRGQAFAQKHYFGVLLSILLFVGNYFLWNPLNQIFKYFVTFDNLTTLRRLIFSTAIHYSTWLDGDLWDPSGEAYLSMKYIQEKHLEMGFIANKNKTDVDSSKIDTSKMPEVLKDCRLAESIRTSTLSSTCPLKVPERRMYLSQQDWAMGAIACVFPVVLHPEKAGVHGATEKEIEDYVYMWKVLCYHMGMDDKYNPFSGTLSETRKLCHEACQVFQDQLRYFSTESEFGWRMMAVSTQDYSAIMNILVNFDSVALFVFWACDFNSVVSSALKVVSWYAKVYFTMIKFLTKYLCRFPVVVCLLNYTLHVVVKRIKKQCIDHNKLYIPLSDFNKL